MFFTFLLALATASLASSAAVERALLPPSEADYVIIGGGTAGLTVAYRLAQKNPSLKVVVLEAGGDPYLTITPPIPAAWVLGSGTAEYIAANDWGFKTPPLAGFGNRQVHYTHGKAIGGSSIRNAMLYQRPTKDSLDQWVTLGNPGWGWNELFPYFQKTFDFTPPNNGLRGGLNYTPSYDQSTVPTGSPLHTSFSNKAQQFSPYFQKALQAQGIQPINGFTSGELIGSSWALTTIDPNSEYRSSSYDLSHIDTPSNLEIISGALGKKIVFDNSTTPKAIGVDYINGLFPANIKVNKEVIVSGGTVQSPQILMVSGIGPKEQLQPLGIPVVSELPGVGKNLQEHGTVGVAYEVDHSKIETLGDTTGILQIVLNGGRIILDKDHPGLLASQVADMIAFDRLNDTFLNSIGGQELAAYPKQWPHLEYLGAPGYVGDWSNLFGDNFEKAQIENKYYVSIIYALVAPLSRGEITITSADTNDQPLINPGVLTNQVDQKVAIEALRKIRRFFKDSDALTPILKGGKNATEAFPGSQYVTDEQILNVTMQNLQHFWHAGSSCAMLPREKNGVLDTQLRVYGVQGVRVVDQSAFPMLPPGHPQSVTYALAERAADIITNGHL